ncbi:acidic mammalian chitinase-like [Palaemon carinicauda]|uniref:acidic mammalian chitinase-like n=1 Tax=Palaemon carinicauda TaxID=392227 RepID=UPI0035B6100F
MLHVCYYAIPRKCSDNTMKPLPVEDIDPFLCTHLIVAFARIRENSLVPENENDIEVYRKVTDLKKRNPDLKILLSLGGGLSDGGFPNLVRDPEAIVQFAARTREFLLENCFDGLDLDWEFPSWPVWKRDKCEKHLFSELVRHLHDSLKLEPPLLLTVAVAGPKSIIDRAYEVHQLVKYVDFFFLMGYDYHIFWPYLPFTGHNAPLLKRSGEKLYFATMNIQWSSSYWLKKGMEKEKLVIGIPTFGRSWRLMNSSWHSVGSPATGQGMLNGIISYSEAMEFLREGAEQYFDEESRVPYATRNKDWISYEDSQSISEKVQWIKNQGFAGVMTWNLNCDNWAGLHSGKKFELNHVIKEILSGD